MQDLAMLDYKKRVARIGRASLIILGLFVLGALTPYTTIFLGLALGASVSIFNFFVMARRINKIGELAANTDLHSSKRPVFSGILTRFSVVILAVMLASKYPEYINIFSMISGLFVTQAIVIVDSIKNRF